MAAVLIFGAGTSGRSAESAAEPIVLRPIRPSEFEEKREIAREQLGRLYAGKFDELEAEAARLRISNATLRDGSTRRQAFYASFSYADWDREPDWEGFEKALVEWQTKFPKSDAVRLAKAAFLVDYAWDARGSRYADTVTREGWRLFGERLADGKRQLDGISSPEMKNEFYWESLLTLALGLQIPKEMVFEFIEPEISRSACRSIILDRMVIFLLPRWYGERGEWQAWLQKQTPGSDADEDYALAATTAVRYVREQDGPPFGEGGANWDRVKAGLLKREARFPESATVKTLLLEMAMYAGDRETAQQVATRMKGLYEPCVLTGKSLERIEELLR